MSENPLFAARAGDIPIKAAAALTSALSKVRSNQETVFVDVGARRIEPNIARDGVPVVAHRIDPEVLKQVVTGEPIIAYRVIDQSVAAGSAVPLGTTVDVVLARPGILPVGIVQGVHQLLQQTRVSEAFDRLVRGKPQAQRLASRAAEGPLSPTDEQVLRDLFQTGDVPIEDVPGRDVKAAITTLQMLTTFGSA